MTSEISEVSAGSAGHGAIHLLGEDGYLGIVRPTLRHDGEETVEDGDIRGQRLKSVAPLDINKAVVRGNVEVDLFSGIVIENDSDNHWRPFRASEEGRFAGF